MLDLNQAQKSREVRIFISSTFSDMNGERDHLIKKTFPRLRALARERGVELNEVDLRWGVTEEQSRNGEVIRICLEEIRRCKPYFIGLLGHRYGWIPGTEELHKQPRTGEDFPEVYEHVKNRLSVTEMEIQHGVLRDPGMHDKAYFYFRGVAFSRRLQDAEDAGGTDSQNRVVYIEAEEEAVTKLDSLKRSVTQTAAIPPQQYNSFEELADRVYGDFEAFLDKEYPAGEKPTGLDKQRLEHAEFAATRLGLYLGGAEYFEQLDSQVEAGGARVLVTGESGSGKTSLMANWIAHRQRANPQEHILYHFCGGAPDSAGVDGLLRRIWEELRATWPEAYPGKLSESPDNKPAIPRDPLELRIMFPEALARIPSDVRFTLVLDAVNQLDDPGRMEWWPNVLPQHVSVVVSTLFLDDRGIANPQRLALGERDYREIFVKPLVPDDRKVFIAKYLGRYQKALSEDLVEKIAQDKESGNPLVLKTLLEELRQYGNHDTLGERLDWYLQTDSHEAFFERVVERITEDYPRAGEVMALIECSRFGLSDSEILQLMNPGDPEYTAFPPVAWATLFNVLEPHLKVSNGLVKWFHDLLKGAVETTLLNEELKAKNYGRLADFFLEGDRKLEAHAIAEWPWHLQTLGDLERMRAEFMDWDTQVALIDRHPEEAWGFWRQLGDSEYVGKAFEQLWENWEVGAGNLSLWSSGKNNISLFLADWVCHYRLSLDMAESLYKERLHLCGKNHLSTVDAMQNLALRYADVEDHAKALKMAKKVYEARKRKHGTKASATLTALHNLALAHVNMGDNTQALMLSKRVYEARKGLFGNGHPDTFDAMHNLALRYADAGRHAQAMTLAERAYDAYRRLLGQNHPNTLKAMNNLALNHADAGDNAKALELAKKVLDVRRGMFGEDHPDTLDAMHNLAKHYGNAGDNSKALTLSERVYEARRIKLGEGHPATLRAMQNLAIRHHEAGDNAEALVFAEMVFEARRDLHGEDHPDTLATMHNLANLYSSAGDNAMGLELTERVYKARKGLLGENHPDTLATMNNLVLRYSDTGDNDKALALAEKVYEARRGLLGEGHPETLGTMQNLANCYADAGDNTKALNLNKKLYDAFRRLLGENHPDTLTAKQNLANRYSDAGDNARALKLGKRVYHARRGSLGKNHPKTLDIMHNLACFYAEAGDNAMALEFAEKVYETSRELLGNDHPATLGTIHNLACWYADSGDNAKALELTEKVLETRMSLLGENHPDTLATMHNLVHRYSDTGDNDKALTLAERVYKARLGKLGKDHPETLKTMNNLASCYANAGDHAKALELAKRAYEGIRDKQGENHPDSFRAMHTLGCRYADVGEYVRALELTEMVCKALRSKLGANHSETLDAMCDLAGLYADVGENAKAMDLIEQVYEARRSKLGADHPNTLASMEKLANLCAAGDNAKALTLAERVLKARRNKLGENPPDTLKAMQALEQFDVATDYGKK